MFIFSLIALEQKKRTSLYFRHPPNIIWKVPNIKPKWKILPGYKISDRIPVEKARNILIATSPRFGSTFLGDILNHYPGTFYSFEPLHPSNLKVYNNAYTKCSINN